MKWLENMMDKFKPLFEKGGKLELFYPLYEAGETFLLTPAHVTKEGPHVHDAIDMKRVMIFVVVALTPCILLGMYNAGHQYNVVNQVADANFLKDMLQGILIVLPIILVSYIFGGLWEVLFAIVRKHEINEGFLVTGLLFPLTLPPTIPLWQVAVGISFGTVIGKEIFGGTGYNILNPALTSRAFLFFAYPGQITGDTIWTKVADKANVIDGFTGATPLAVAAGAAPGTNAVEALQGAGFTLKSMLIGLEGGSIAETSVIAVLLGALILLATGIASWRIMLSGVLGLTATGLLLNHLPGDALTPFAALPFYYHLAMGGFAFGIVFMATDPVSAAATRTGKWIYGFLIGFLTVLIRVVNPAFPEGVMLSILFMNVMAPMIDHFVVQAHIKRRTRNWRPAHA